jgi:hypothetical protein
LQAQLYRALDPVRQARMMVRDASAAVTDKLVIRAADPPRTTRVPRAHHHTPSAAVFESLAASLGPLRLLDEDQRRPSGPTEHAGDTDGMIVHCRMGALAIFLPLRPARFLGVVALEEVGD